MLVKPLSLLLYLCYAGPSHARQNAAERARGQIQQRADKLAHAASSVFARAEPDYRFYNNKTAG